MLGETSVGLYVAYGFICLFLLVVVVLTLRVVVLVSLLWLTPVAEAFRRFRRDHRPPSDRAE